MGYAVGEIASENYTSKGWNETFCSIVLGGNWKTIGGCSGKIMRVFVCELGYAVG